MNSEVTTISAERLKELETLEASIPSMIENAIQEYKKSNLKKLHERDKANPAAINMRVKRYVERHREEINKKRREKRLQQKLEKKPEEANKVVLDLPTKVESIYIRAATDAIAKSEDHVVRKQYKKKKLDGTVREEERSPSLSSLPDRKNDITVRFDL
jgi:hypothetical protein